MSNISKPLKHIRYFVKKILPTLSKCSSMINIVLNQKKNQNAQKRKLVTGCYVKKTENKNIKGLALENKIEQQKLTCVDCDFKKSTF